ncbi:hypothetical protein ISS30_01040 [bacterium]|nr:hypothetical protein [bacterium]
MKNFSTFSVSFLILALLLIPVLTSAQPQILMGQLRGIFGTKDQYVIVYFSDAEGNLEPTNQSANSGEYYHFLLIPAGDWNMDQKFLQKNLPNLTFQQDGNFYTAARHTPMYDGNKIGKLLISVEKVLDVTKGFSINYDEGDIHARIDFKIPEKLWPGHTKVYGAYVEARSLLENEKRIEAFRKAKGALADTAAKKFSFYEGLKDIRAQAYAGFSNVIVVDFNNIPRDGTLNLEEILSKYTALDERYRVFFDSLKVDSALFAADPRLKETYDSALENRAVLQDNIQKEKIGRDNALIGFMASADYNNYKYKFLLNGIYWLFRAQDANKPFNYEAPLPDTVVKQLSQSLVDLTEPMNAVRRTIQRNIKANQPLIPDYIAYNLINNADKSAVPKEYAVLALDSYYQGYMDNARVYIRKALRMSSDIGLNEWLGDIEMYINFQLNQSEIGIFKHVNESMELLKSGKKDKAFQMLIEAENISPKSPLINYSLGYYYLVTAEITTDTTTAINYFDRTIRFDPKMTNAYRRLYNLYIVTSKWTDAVNTLKQALTNADYWEFNFFLAHCLLETGQLSEALEYCRKSIEINPRIVDNYILEFDIHFARGDKQMARAAYDRGIELDPANKKLNDRYMRLNR